MRLLGVPPVLSPPTAGQGHPSAQAQHTRGRVTSLPSLSHTDTSRRAPPALPRPWFAGLAQLPAAPEDAAAQGKDRSMLPTSAAHSHFHTPSVNGVTHILLLLGHASPMDVWPISLPIAGFPPLCDGGMGADSLGFFVAHMPERWLCGQTSLNASRSADSGLPGMLRSVIAQCQWVWSHHDMMCSTLQLLHPPFIPK